MAQDEDAEALRRQGHRLTPQRLQVLQVVRSCGQHLTVEAIHAAIVPQQPYLDIATVYRSLQWLQAAGLVAPLHLGGRLHYEYRRHGEHHHHLICRHCGAYLQIADTDLATLKAELYERYGFHLDMDHLVLRGCCAQCRAG